MKPAWAREYVGKRFGKLLVLEEGRPYNNTRRMVCQCDCGNTLNVMVNNLANGRTRSCKACRT